jgi:PAS domain S-box-containing protein
VSWIQSLGRADRDTDGRIARITGLELDVTKRRRDEDALQTRRDEEHDRELRLLLETATQGILEVDAEGSIVTANRALEAMFGWAPGELIGEPIERLISPAIRDLHRQHRGAYFAAPRPRPMGGGLRLIGERKDGSTFPVEVSLNHVATGSGGRAIAFVTDTTERDRAASALQERSAELERRTSQLSQMAWELTLAEHHAREQIARTLHDGLQQLLVIVSLNLDQQLQRDRDAGLSASELLSDAKHQIDEAIKAARSLHVELFPPVLHHAGLAAALQWLANWAHEKYKLAVTVHGDPQVDVTRKDVRTLLYESVRELLFNAFKHARAQHVTVELAVAADGQLLVTVNDDGVGFDSAALDDRSSARQPGWGLFSIRERLTLLGGHVAIQSAPGKGTCIRLFAPCGAMPDGIATMSGPSSTKLRILMVDDHAALRSTMREILHRHPELSVVGEASDGVEAIASARALLPDVILMDVAMPRMDGLEATARIHKELPQIQIFGLSMEPRGGGAHPIERAGASDFFVKNVDIQRLVDRLLLLQKARGGAAEGA